MNAKEVMMMVVVPALLSSASAMAQDANVDEADTAAVTWDETTNYASSALREHRCRTQERSLMRDAWTLADELSRAGEFQAASEELRVFYNDRVLPELVATLDPLADHDATLARDLLVTRTVEVIDTLDALDAATGDAAAWEAELRLRLGTLETQLLAVRTLCELGVYANDAHFATRDVPDATSLDVQPASESDVERAAARLRGVRGYDANRFALDGSSVQSQDTPGTAEPDVGAEPAPEAVEPVTPGVPSSDPVDPAVEALLDDIDAPEGEQVIIVDESGVVHR